MTIEEGNGGRDERGPDDANESVSEKRRSKRDSVLADVGVSRRQLLSAAGATVAGSAIATNVSMASEPSGDDAPGTGVAIVVLDLEPLARHRGNRPDHARKLAEQRGAFKRWMANEAPRAEVIYEYETVLNGLAVRLNDHSVDTLRGGPGVRYATSSQPVYPTLGRSLDLIGTGDAWDEFEDAALAGKGVKVAIIDTGIEHNHDDGFFDGNGLADPGEGWPKGNGDEWDFDEDGFTNNKVIAAYVFWDDESADLDPGDEFGHGTHVAGIAGGRSGTKTELGEEVSGVAPGAWLGNYNVFAGGSPTAEENVIAAVEQAVEDGFDVINMSLGGPIDEPEDPLMEASESAVEAGVVVVSSAGNSGPGDETITSPAAAPNVTAVGASTNAWGVFDTLFVYEGDAGPDLDNPVAYLPGVEGGEMETAFKDELIIAWADLDDRGSTTELACDGQGPPHDLPDLEAEFGTNPVVIVQRGECSFAEKAQNIKDAGGKAMIVYNTDDADEEELVTMTLQNEVQFPSAFITNGDGRAIRAVIDQHSEDVDEPRVDITFDEAEFDRTHNVLAEFSSRGPGPNLEIKPEVTAPGVNIYSSVPEGDWAPLSGTSMSSPHVAGAAALMRALEPDWEVQMVRSALVNTAAPTVDVEVGADGPMGRGNGLVQVGDAVETILLANPATVSFGQLASRGPAFRTTAERDVLIENQSGDTVELTIRIDDQSALEPNVTVAANEKSGEEITITLDDTVTLTLTANGSGQANGTYWGQVQLVNEEGVVMTIPFWYRVGR